MTPHISDVVELVGGPCDGQIVTLPMGTRVWSVPLPARQVLSLFNTDDGVPPSPRRATYRRRGGDCDEPLKFDYTGE